MQGRIILSILCPLPLLLNLAINSIKTHEAEKEVTAACKKSVAECNTNLQPLHQVPTFASAVKSVALTPGVLAIFWPTAAKMLQFRMTAT